MEEQRKAFSKLLGLNELVPYEVFKVALINEDYARNLVLASEEDDKQYLEFWINNPPEINVKQYSNINLITNASKALIKWAQSGFTRVDSDVLARRENACMNCPHLELPKTLLQKWNTSKVENKLGKQVSNKICGLCGCNLDKKLPIITSFCPSSHPEKKDISRWEEPLINHETL